MRRAASSREKEESGRKNEAVLPNQAKHRCGHGDAGQLGEDAPVAGTLQLIIMEQVGEPLCARFEVGAHPGRGKTNRAEVPRFVP